MICNKFCPTYHEPDKVSNSHNMLAILEEHIHITILTDNLPSKTRYLICYFYWFSINLNILKRKIICLLTDLNTTRLFVKTKYFHWIKISFMNQSFVTNIYLQSRINKTELWFIDNIYPSTISCNINHDSIFWPNNPGNKIATIISYQHHPFFWGHTVLGSHGPTLCRTSPNNCFVCSLNLKIEPWKF